MKEIFGNLWDFNGVLCITTNGTLRKDGACIMGRGVAYQAKNRYPQLPYSLGHNIKYLGNHVFFYNLSGPQQPQRLITFPVKHNWWEKADLKLIAQSVQELIKMNQSLGNVNVYLHRPGCGNGGLSWTEVKPLISVLPDNIYIVGWPNEKDI